MLWRKHFAEYEILRYLVDELEVVASLRLVNVSSVCNLSWGVPDWVLYSSCSQPSLSTWYNGWHRCVRYAVRVWLWNTATTSRNGTRSTAYAATLDYYNTCLPPWQHRMELSTLQQRIGMYSFFLTALVSNELLMASIHFFHLKIKFYWYTGFPLYWHNNGMWCKPLFFYHKPVIHTNMLRACSQINNVIARSMSVVVVDFTSHILMS